MLIFAAIVAVVVAGVAVRNTVTAYQKDIALLTQQRDELERRKAESEIAFSDSITCVAILSELGADEEKNSELFALLNSISPNALKCTTEKFPDLPSVRLAYIADHSTRPDGSWSTKSAHILIKDDSLDVIDFVLDDGAGAIAISTGPFTTDDLQFGSYKNITAKYVITPTGFARAD